MYANVNASILYVYMYIRMLHTYVYSTHIYIYKRAHARKTTHTVQYLQYISTSIPGTWIITTSLFDNVDHVCKTLSLSLAGMDPIRLIQRRRWNGINPHIRGG